MKRIAVFCALPPDRNTGMATVDLAAFTVLRRIAPDAQIVLYTYGALTSASYEPEALPYQYLDVKRHREDYFSSDIFVFWGDFTHSRSYWNLDRGLAEGQLATVSPKIDDPSYRRHTNHYSEYVFLTMLPPERRRAVVVFGSTIITNGAKDENDELYFEHFQKFFEQVTAVYFRDALSAARIAPFRRGETTLGCDCALLLHNDDLRLFQGFKQASERKGVGHRVQMMLFSRMVGRAVGESCHWIHWLTGGKRWKQRLYRLLGYAIPGEAQGTGNLLSQLSGYKYIVTDTYHLCVNAWRMGIPAICIGQGAMRTQHSISDKKKEMFYCMYGASDMYVFSESLLRMRTMRQQSKRVAAALCDVKLVSRVSRNIEDHQRMALTRLSESLRTLIESP
jgi:hypothetical protein